MLRNKLYVYGEQNKINVPIDLNFGKHLLKKFRIYGDCIALIDSLTGETMTYTELAQLTVDIAISLARMGFGKGDVVAISSEERMEFLPTILGIMCAGATFTSLGSSGTATMLHKASLSTPKVVFCSPGTYQQFRKTLESVKSIEKFIVYGEVERPGVQRFQEFLKQGTSVDDFMAADVEGWRDVALIMYSSGTTGLSKGVPWTHLNMFGKMDAHFHPGQRVVVPTDFYRMNITCLEAGATVVFIPRDDAAVVLEAVDKHKVVDLNTREPIGAYQRGEMCFKTASMFPGYVGVEPPTHLDSEGFYKTGDVGYYDDDGYFFVVDRIRDLIKYDDCAVHPADLEAVLTQHAGVREACVVGAPHARHGELPTAFVVLRDGARVGEQELADFVNEQVTVMMRLTGGVRFVVSLPRGARGKFDRKSLREILQD